MRYVFESVVRVVVDMADSGAQSDVDGEPIVWGPGEQEESAREWAEQAMPLHETFPEPWVTIECPPLKLIRTAPSDEAVPHAEEHDHERNAPWWDCEVCRRTNHYGFKGNFR